MVSAMIVRSVEISTNSRPRKFGHCGSGARKSRSRNSERIAIMGKNSKEVPAGSKATAPRKSMQDEFKRIIAETLG